MAARSRVSGRRRLVAAVGLVLAQCAIEARTRLHAGIGARAFLGCAPGLLSAFALPFLFFGLSVSRAAAAGDWSRAWRETRNVAVAAAVATGGLLGRGFVQPYRPDRTFDWLDACATLAGALSFPAIVGTGRMFPAQDARKTEFPTP